MIFKFRKEPIQRQRWGDNQCLPHTDWGDIFFDLFYVAAAYNLAYIIKTDPNLLGLLYFLGCFGPVVTIWLRKLYYDSVFNLPDDIFHVGLEIIQLLFLAGAILHIRPVKYMSNESYPAIFFFCLSCWLCSVYTICSYLEIRFWGVDGEYSAKYSAMTSIFIHLPGVLLVSAATMYSGHAFYYRDRNDNYSNEEESFQHIPIILMLSSWIVQQVVLYPVHIWRGKGNDFKKYHIPVNVEFIIHRQGEFTMLMLGESVLSLLTTDLASSENNEFYFTFYCGVLSVTLLQYLYFKSQPHDADGHAMRRSRPGALLFVIFIQIYSAALVIVGVSFKMLLTEYKYDNESDSEAMVKEYESSSSSNYGRFLAGSGDEKSMYSDEERRQRIATFFCVGLGISFLSLDLLTLAHLGIKAIHDRFYNVKGVFARAVVLSLNISRFLITAFIFTVFLHTTEPELVALYGLISIILQVFVSLVGYIFFPPEESSHGQKQSSNDDKSKTETMHLSTRTQSKLFNLHNGEHNLYEENLHDQMQSSNDAVKEVEVMNWPNRTHHKSVHLDNGEHNLYEENLHDQTTQSSNDEEKNTEAMHLPNRTQPKLFDLHNGDHYEEYSKDHHDVKEQQNDDHHLVD